MYSFQKGFYTDVRIEDRFTTRLVLRGGGLQEAKVTAEKKAFIRVYDGNMWYYASTDDVGTIQETIQKLYAYAQPNEDIENDPIVKLYEVNRDEKLVFADRCVKDIPLGDKLKLITETDGRLKSPLCGFQTAQYIDRYSLYAFYSSKGAEIKYDFQNCGVAYGMAFTRGEDTVREQLSKARTDFGQLGYSDGEGEIRVMFYEDGALLNCLTVNENTLAWS